MSAAVVPLSPFVAAACPVCGAAAEFQIGPGKRACRVHVGDVLAHFYENGWDGFAPATVTPLAGARLAARSRPFASPGGPRRFADDGEA